MVNIESGCHLKMKNSDKPCAMVEVKCSSEMQIDESNKINNELSLMLWRTLRISGENIYTLINYEPYWGWNGVKL